MTVPRSSGCTRTSSRLPRRESTSRTRTSSGLSTMPLTRCSSAGRSAPSVLVGAGTGGVLCGLRDGLAVGLGRVGSLGLRRLGLGGLRSSGDLLRLRLGLVSLVGLLSLGRSLLGSLGGGRVGNAGGRLGLSLVDLGAAL